MVSTSIPVKKSPPAKERERRARQDIDEQLLYTVVLFTFWLISNSRPKPLRDIWEIEEDEARQISEPAAAILGDHLDILPRWLVVSLTGSGDLIRLGMALVGTFGSRLMLERERVNEIRQAVIREQQPGGGYPGNPIPNQATNFGGYSQAPGGQGNGHIYTAESSAAEDLFAGSA